MNRRQIAELVSPDELREILQLMVRTPSPNLSGDVMECGAAIVGLFEREGIPDGPGQAPDAHTADEHVGLSDVVKAAHMYTLAALDLLEPSRQECAQ
ncbi:MAG: hypothetical protein HYU43_09900 [Armatimonadetes bacterium]|nr:hypothetical protein [Armatimonadota bacterium]